MSKANDWGMEAPPKSVKVAPPPYTEEEIRWMYNRDRSALDYVFQKAKARNGWGRARVRMILFGENY